VASTPSQLGVASGQELAWLQQLDEPELATARRRLLQAAEPDAPSVVPVLSGLRRAAARLLLAAPQSKAAVQAAGARAAAGAPQVVYLESNNRFSLEVKLLDHWGSNVVSNSSRPMDATIRLLDTGSPGSSARLAVAAAPDGASSGSLCARSCEPGRPCTTGCLSGATTVAFKEGVANFSSIGLSAPPNSSFLMQVCCSECVFGSGAAAVSPKHCQVASHCCLAPVEPDPRCHQPRTPLSRHATNTHARRRSRPEACAPCRWWTWWSRCTAAVWESTSARAAPVRPALSRRSTWSRRAAADAAAALPGPTASLASQRRSQVRRGSRRLSFDAAAE
jgi:hypothetical protein